MHLQQQEIDTGKVPNISYNELFGETRRLGDVLRRADLWPADRQVVLQVLPSAAMRTKQIHW